MNSGEYSGQIRYMRNGSKEDRFLLLDTFDDSPHRSFRTLVYHVYFCREDKFGFLGERYIKEFTIPWS
jgi:hypothetical protein